MAGVIACAEARADHDREVHRTIIFNIFVLMQVFNLFNARKLEDGTGWPHATMSAEQCDIELNVVAGLERNWLFWVIVAVIGVGQALLVQFGSSAVPV